MSNFTEAHLNEMGGELSEELAAAAWRDYQQRTGQQTIIDDMEAMEWNTLNYIVETTGAFDSDDRILVES